MSRNLFELDPETIRAQARASRARHHAASMIGAGGCNLPKVAMDPDCYDVEHLRCYYEIVANSALAVAATTAFTIQLQPDNCPFFDPRAVSAVATDSVDFGLVRLVRFTDVNIQGCPQEAIRNAAPLVGTTSFWTSRKWDPATRNGCACPVSWGVFSNAANSFPLNVVGFNQNPLATTITIEVYGDCLSVLEAGLKCGVRRKKPEMTNGVTNGGRVFPSSAPPRP